MAEQIIQALDAASLRTLQELVDQFRNQLGNTPNRYSPGAGDLTAPDVYVALSPAGGIPAMIGVAPGSASCQVYQQQSGTLIAFGISQTVCNLGSAIPAGVYLLVGRDKVGSWYALSFPPGLASCSSVTATETDIRCEGGELNLYNRTVTYTPSATTGCLTKAEGAWRYVRTVSTCTLSPDTGTAAPNCPCPSVTSSLCMTVAGVTSGASCPVAASYFNGSYVLSYLGACSFLCNKTFKCLSTDTALPFRAVLVYDPVLAMWTLTFITFDNSVLMVYRASTWDCHSPLVLTRFGAASDPFYGTATWPSTLTIRLCTDTGTGTGTNAGGTCTGQMFGMGSATSGGSVVAGLDMPLVAVSAGLLVVNVNATGTTPTQVKYNGVAMTKIRDVSVTASGVTLCTSQWYLAVAAQTGTIEVIGTLGAVQMNAINDTGLVSNLPDVGASASSALGGSADSGTTSASSTACELVHGVVGLIGTLGSWSLPMIDGGQNVVDTIASGSVITLSEGRQIATAVGTFFARANASDFGWNAAVESYK